MRAVKLKHCDTLFETFSIKINTDLYVCIDIRIEKEVPDNSVPLYWRLVDESFSLLMIGIDKASGRLRSVKVVLYNRQFDRLDSGLHRGVPIDSLEGIPVFSLDIWEKSSHTYDASSDIYDVHGRCKLKLGSDKLHIIIFKDQISYETSLNDFICQFNNANELCGVIIKNLSLENINMLKRFSASRSLS